MKVDCTSEVGSIMFTQKPPKTQILTYLEGLET